jgi:hypothetical protein
MSGCSFDEAQIYIHIQIESGGFSSKMSPLGGRRGKG